MQDTIEVQESPWSCGGEDGCPNHWHHATYLQDQEGNYYLDNYGDGDTDPIDAEDIPTPEQVKTAWEDYYRYVAQTNHDPLKEFENPTTMKTHEWQVRIRNWIGSQKHGLKVTGARRRGKGPWKELQETPKELQEFLNPTPNQCLGEELKSFADLKDHPLQIKNELEAWLLVKVLEYKTPLHPTPQEQAKHLLRNHRVQDHHEEQQVKAYR